MDKIIINGGRKLSGTVSISGAKNSAVAILPATLLADEGISKITNLPNIEDMHSLEKTIKFLGGTISSSEHEMLIDCSTINSYSATNEETKHMRASYYLLSPLLLKFGKVELNFPGGCSIGARPINFHLKALQMMGASYETNNGLIKIEAPNGLTGTTIYFDTVSVGATINIMLAASKAKGTTILKNAAKEPHVIDVANLLNKMGAIIHGVGTDTITIKGVEKLHAVEHSVVPDQIEAGTYMIAAAATQGDVLIKNVVPAHLDFLCCKLEEMGVSINKTKDSIRVFCTDRPLKNDIKTAPYPGFPTDLQQPMSTLFGIAAGTSVIREGIWENRFKHLNELQKMGMQFKIENNVAIIEGVETLSGTEVEATDLRGGAAMVIAGLVANGTTTITNTIHIDRGYEFIESKLQKLGANIIRTK